MVVLMQVLILFGFYALPQQCEWIIGRKTNQFRCNVTRVSDSASFCVRP
jgi:hypothetical protein